MTKDELLLELEQKFQGEIFGRVVKKYGGSIKASKFLRIPASSIRNYKNLYFKSVPKIIIERLISLEIINSNELNKNIIKTFYRNDQIRSSLDLGIKVIRLKFRNIKRKIPKLKEIMTSEELNLAIWLDKYLLLASSNLRKITVKSNLDYLNIKYNNFTRNGFKDFEVNIPKKFVLTPDFLYFFGLWCGDRSGGKRFGVCNKNKDIINFTQNFLKRSGQDVERILYITKGLETPKIIYDKKFVIDKDVKGWVLSVHSNNGILASFFYYLQNNLEEFLRRTDNKYPFFAGLFDAEGNVSLHNNSFRWACKNDKLVKIYSKFLREVSLFDRYDGGCLISYNKNQFFDKVLPYMKQGDKINLTKVMCTGQGNLPESHLNVLSFINSHPKNTSKDISKALKKTKVYSELRLLSDFGFVSYDGYPHKFKISPKGEKLLGD